MKEPKFRLKDRAFYFNICLKTNLITASKYVNDSGGGTHLEHQMGTHTDYMFEDTLYSNYLEFETQVFRTVTRQLHDIRKSMGGGD